MRPLNLCQFRKHRTGAGAWQRLERRDEGLGRWLSAQTQVQICRPHTEAWVSNPSAPTLRAGGHISVPRSPQTNQCADSKGTLIQTRYKVDRPRETHIHTNTSVYRHKHHTHILVHTETQHTLTHTHIYTQTLNTPSLTHKHIDVQRYYTHVCAHRHQIHTYPHTHMRTDIDITHTHGKKEIIKNCQHWYTRWKYFLKFGLFKIDC